MDEDSDPLSTFKSTGITTPAKGNNETVAVVIDVVVDAVMVAIIVAFVAVVVPVDDNIRVAFDDDAVLDTNDDDGKSGSSFLTLLTRCCYEK